VHSGPPSSSHLSHVNDKTNIAYSGINGVFWRCRAYICPFPLPDPPVLARIRRFFQDSHRLISTKTISFPPTLVDKIKLSPFLAFAWDYAPLAPIFIGLSDQAFQSFTFFPVPIRESRRRRSFFPFSSIRKTGSPHHSYYEEASRKEILLIFSKIYDYEGVARSTLS